MLVLVQPAVRLGERPVGSSGSAHLSIARFYRRRGFVKACIESMESKGETQAARQRARP